MDRPGALIDLLPASLNWSRDGDVRVVGRRISLFDILNAHRALGKSPKVIAEDYELAPEVVCDVLALAERHPSEVDAYMRACQAETSRRLAAYQPGQAALRISRMVAERELQKPELES